MSWFKNTASRRTWAVAGASLAIISVLSGCQIKPLYSEASPATASMASVEFSEATSRVEQQVRNALIFHASGGAGIPLNPKYKVTLSVTSQVRGVLYDQASDTPAAGRIIVTADYNLMSVDAGNTITSGRRSAVALVDFPTQEFAKVRAIRDGEDRAARELAEILRAEIAAALGR